MFLHPIPLTVITNYFVVAMTHSLILGPYLWCHALKPLRAVWVSVLQRGFEDLWSFKDFCPKIHLCLHLYIQRYSKNMETLKFLKEFLNWQRFFIFMFGPFSKTKESSYSSLVHFPMPYPPMTSMKSNRRREHFLR